MRPPSTVAPVVDVVGPCLVMDLDVVRERHAALASAFPGAALRYAVKANPAPQVLRALAAAGCGFDVASPGEIDACLAAGADPAMLSYGNPVRKARAVAHAVAAGVATFTTDSREDLAVLAGAAPGATVWARIAVDETGAATPFAGKFGCSVAEAAALLQTAPDLGLVPDGVAFHVGSQQRHPAAFVAGIAAAARVFAVLGRRLRTLNLGGGLPARYAGPPTPLLPDYAAAVSTALARHFPGGPPRLVLEPGRALVAAAGVIHAEVVLVTWRSGRRWVYLDVGRYGGLAETEGEAIVYPVSAAGRGGPTGPVVLAGPTCDGDDVLYRRATVELPLWLRAGDRVRILATGAYTASYASVGFNGLPPLPVRCVGQGS